MVLTRDALIDDQTFAVVDVETTGMSAMRGDRICEIGVVMGRGTQILDQWQQLINPGRPISIGASAVNGISDRMVRNSPYFYDIAAELSEKLSGAVIVAHNASFDMSFISSELRASGYEPPANPVVDTLALARRLYSFPSNSLGNIARSLGIKAQGLHRALADATVTWFVLKHFLNDLRDADVTTLGELLRLQGGITRMSGWHVSAPPLMEWDGGEFNPIQGLPPAIEQAVRSQAAIRIRYTSERGQASVRTVEARKVTLRAESTYLVAFCHLRKEERTFRLDRLQVLGIEEAVG